MQKPTGFVIRWVKLISICFSLLTKYLLIAIHKCTFTCFKALWHHLSRSVHHIPLGVSGTTQRDTNCPIRGKICQRNGFLPYFMSVFLPVLQLCGIAFLVLGIIFRWGSQELRNETKTAMSEVQVSGYAAYDLFNSAAILFVITGAVIIIISFLGFVGACCTARWALYIVSRLGQ